MYWYYLNKWKDQAKYRRADKSDPIWMEVGRK